MKKQLGVATLPTWALIAALVGCGADRPGFGTPSDTEPTDGVGRDDAGVSEATSDVSAPSASTDGTAPPVNSLTPVPSTTTPGTAGDACNQCSPQQRLCTDGQIADCVQQAGCWVWGAPLPCPELACKDASECTTCTDACSLGETACVDGGLQTCAAGSEGCNVWLAPIPCPTGNCATESICFECDDQCEFGAASCVAGELSLCEADDQGCLDWGTPTPCGNGACTTETACGQCDDPCEVGDARCEDGSSSECVADSEGCLGWSAPEACASGACSTATECLVCNDECPGEAEANCEGRQLQTCVADADGCLAWSAPMTCEYVCNAEMGACDGSCTPDDVRCNDQQPQVCNADGAWEDSGAACSGCTSCSVSSATCVVNTGTSCDDDNACTTGESCQSSGACSGGSAVTCPGADECHAVGACQPSTGCPAPTVTTASCDDDNPCITGESCQASGSCGGGTPASITTSCGTNEYCDGSGGCGCRTKSSWNLLANPGFNGAATSWTLAGGASYVASEDVDGCEGSGSVLINALAANVSQCVPGLPTTNYYFGFRFKALGGASAAGTAVCNIFFLPTGSSCTGTGNGSGSATQAYNTNNWIQGSVSTLLSEPDTAMIRVNCVGPAAAGYYDQIYLSTTSPGVPSF